MATPASANAVIDNAAWQGNELAAGAAWLRTLDAAETDALLDMAAAVRRALSGDPNRLLKLGRDAFDLGAFAPRVSDLFAELKDGVGLVVLRGLPIGDVEPLDAATIFWAIGRHLGDATPNNPDGDMLGHVTDLGKTQSDPNSRGYQTRETMDYHCDQCDIVGLLCVRTAKSGGVSKVASSVAMYNTLQQERPDLAEALKASLYWTKHGEFAPGESPYYRSPVFNFLNGKLCTSFGPKHILKGHALPGVPPLTDLQREAITVAERIADAQRFEMVFEPGDMQFANNYVVLHTRSEYQDHDDPAKKRLLWRLWLMNPQLRTRTGYTEQWLNGVQPGTDHLRIRL